MATMFFQNKAGCMGKRVKSNHANISKQVGLTKVEKDVVVQKLFPIKNIINWPLWKGARF